MHQSCKGLRNFSRIFQQCPIGCIRADQITMCRRLLRGGSRAAVAPIHAFFLALFLPSIAIEALSQCNFLHRRDGN